MHTKHELDVNDLLLIEHALALLVAGGEGGIPHGALLEFGRDSSQARVVYAPKNKQAAADHAHAKILFQRLKLEALLQERKHNPPYPILTEEVTCHTTTS